jgi:hypothetical protein
VTDAKDPAADDDARIPLLDDPVELPAASASTTPSMPDFDRFLEEELAAELGAELDEAVDARMFEALQDSLREAPHEHLPGAAAASLLSDQVIHALLDEDWRTASGQLLAARQGGTPQPSPELKARIDREVDMWMAETLRRHVGDLRQRLIAAVGAELKSLTEQRDESEDDAESDRK